MRVVLATLMLSVLWPNPANAQSNSKQMSAAERQACSLKGGAVAPQGMLGYEKCVVPYPDAGRACTSKRQCVGQCLYPEGKRHPRDQKSRVVGQCQPTNSHFGCSSVVEKGLIVSSICVD